MPTACAGNVKEMAERLTAAWVPVPVRLTVWVAGLALSVMVTEPPSVPVEVGVKLMLIEQDEDAATLEPQVLVWEKLPLATTLVMLSAAVPVF